MFGKVQLPTLANERWIWLIDDIKSLSNIFNSSHELIENIGRHFWVIL